MTYKLWVDKETKLPLQKEGAMNKAIQYTTRYTEIEFAESIPENLITIDLNEGFKEVDFVTGENADIDEDKDADVAEHDPEISVDIDMEIEKAEQVAADSGSSPWKLDVYVSSGIHKPADFTGRHSRRLSGKL